MKKIICLLIVFSLIIPTGISAFAADLEWPYLNDTAMPYSPSDNYRSMNNPPSFRWPMVEGVTYELKVCTDRELNDVAFSKSGIEFNVYNFNETFETEKRYYWSVRYKQGSKYSVWSDAREFIIDKNAVEYPMPEMTEEYLSSVIKKEHPRLMLNDEKLAYLKSLTPDSKVYTTAYNYTQTFMEKHKNPKTWEEWNTIFTAGEQGTNGSEYTEIATGLANATLMYLITGNKEYFDFVVEYLEFIKDWDTHEIFIWDSRTDVVEPVFLSALGFVYDWLYNELSEDLIYDLTTFMQRNLAYWWEYVGMSSVLPAEKSLYDHIDRSHQWRVRQLCVGVLAIYGEAFDKTKYNQKNDLAKDVLSHIMPLYISGPPMTFEDGTFDNGPFYYQAGGPMDPDFSDCLYSATDGKIDVTKHVAYHNRAYYLTYIWPVGGFMSIIGDNNLQTSISANMYDVSIQHTVTGEGFSDLKRGINAWMMKKNGRDKDDYYHTYSVVSSLRNSNSDVEYITPTMLLNSRHFKDSGIVSLFSSLPDDNKISMVFRSSEKGSKGHMHPDQNMFVIQALGENLAIDSDYYDYHNSPLYLNWNAKTYSHNSVTYDIGEGQPHSDYAATGKILNFVDHSDFALATGDATKAYKGGIDKFKRDIIYIRPDTYIVIDDLKSRPDTASEFEWWLNTLGDIKLYQSGKGVQITKNEAALDVKVAYPENIETYYNDEFAGPDGNATEFPSGKTYLGDKHIYFKTEPVTETKMVTYMNVHKVRDGQAYVKETKLKNVLKLEFEDGTIVYVKLDNAESVTVDGYTFNGKAFVVKGNRYMTVDETKVTKGDKVLFEADYPVSCAFGNEEICVSTLESETKIKVYMPQTNKFTLIRDDEVLPINISESQYGITANVEGDYVTLDAYYGTYQLYLNDKLLPGAETDVNVDLTIDGVRTSVTTKGYINGNQVYAEFLPEGIEKSYILGESDGISAKLSNPGRLISASVDSPIILNKKNVTLELTSVSPIEPEKEMAEDHDKYESSLSSQVAAINYSEVIGNPGTKFWETSVNNTPHNDTTLNGINNKGDLVRWTLDVPESGNYDVVMSCSTLSGLSALRFLTIGNVAFNGLFKTDIFNDLDSYRFKTNVYLEKGTADLTLYVTGGGSMIYDWVGLIPSDK